MKRLTVKSIRKHTPCYDPTRFVTATWSGTILDVLAMRKVPPEDRIWLATRPRVLKSITLRLFACACARRALSRAKDPDPRSVAAVDAVEKYVLGKSCKADLKLACMEAFYAYTAAYAYAAYAAYAAAAAYASAERRWQVRKLVELIKEHE